MSYQALYNFCQTKNPHISRNVVRDQVLRITGVNRVSTVKTTMDTSACRGFYLSARNTEHRLVQQHGSHIIVLARGQNRCWDRFVFVKELMHLFDSVDEATDTGEEFDRQLAELSGHPSPSWSPQMRSEVECFWKALAALCPETVRGEFQTLLDAGQIDEYGIALKLKIPQQYVQHLFRPEYPDIIRDILNCDNAPD